ncbi:DUF1345 domain-containing protein [Microbacterium sp.]|uniref:DUF1345 domain-containing protein n=1 Tax=Microbacterium sp. TaxID=51671 RepID=UPI003C7306FE
MARSRRSAALLRTLTSLAAGIVAALALLSVFGVAAAVLAGWSVFALTSVVWVVVVIWPMDAEQTRSHATREDPGRPMARVFALVGSLVSLSAVAIVLVQAHDDDRAYTSVMAALAVVSVAASWALIQVDYLLRYAHLYFSHPVGGIDFHQHSDPSYIEFAYFAIGLGMTYQVADTDVSTTEVRRLVIAQTLLAYLFGAVILATVINLVAGLG